MSEFADKDYIPSDPCPVCKKKLHTMRPGKKPLMEDGSGSDEVFCFTLCKHCGTLLEYNLTQDECAVMTQDRIKQIEKLPEYEMLRFFVALYALNYPST